MIEISLELIKNINYFVGSNTVEDAQKNATDLLNSIQIGDVDDYADKLKTKINGIIDTCKKILKNNQSSKILTGIAKGTLKLLDLVCDLINWIHENPILGSIVLVLIIAVVCFVGVIFAAEGSALQGAFALGFLASPVLGPIFRFFSKMLGKMFKIQIGDKIKEILNYVEIISKSSSGKSIMDE